MPNPQTWTQQEYQTAREDISSVQGTIITVSNPHRGSITSLRGLSTYLANQSAPGSPYQSPSQTPPRRPTLSTTSSSHSRSLSYPYTSTSPPSQTVITQIAGSFVSPTYNRRTTATGTYIAASTTTTTSSSPTATHSRRARLHTSGGRPLTQRLASLAKTASTSNTSAEHEGAISAASPVAGPGHSTSALFAATTTTPPTSSTPTTSTSRVNTTARRRQILQDSSVSSPVDAAANTSLWTLMEGLYRPTGPPGRRNRMASDEMQPNVLDLAEVQDQLTNLESTLLSSRNRSPTGRNGEPKEERFTASIRFIPHSDPRATRESLHFSPMERVIHSPSELVKVGRYSDRDAARPNCPVGFKSKVVSRRHCEFWYDAGQWYIKDVKSSSGTFLNHIRLSPPGQESRAYPVHNGDIVQLGIDFKGGEEQIFRCVKMRLELNRVQSRGKNNFNVTAHKNLKEQLASAASGKKRSTADGDSGSTHQSECSICLISVAPCQALFVAPCSHVWHYRCIRPLIEKEWPIFLCPNCRSVADLDREIEDDEDEDLKEWEDADEQKGSGPDEPRTTGLPITGSSHALDVDPTGTITGTSVSTVAPPQVPTVTIASRSTHPTVATTTTSVSTTNGTTTTTTTPSSNPTSNLHSLQTSPRSRAPNTLNDHETDAALLEIGNESSADEGVTINSGSRYAFEAIAAGNGGSSDARSATSVSTRNGGGEGYALAAPNSAGLNGNGTGVGVVEGEGPMTPMNDIGPFVFNGDASRGNHPFI